MENLQMVEYIISIYGRKQSEWDNLSSWIMNNDLYSDNVVWLIQVLYQGHLFSHITFNNYISVKFLEHVFFGNTCTEKMWTSLCSHLNLIFLATGSTLQYIYKGIPIILILSFWNLTFLEIDVHKDVNIAMLTSESNSFAAALTLQYIQGNGYC